MSIFERCYKNRVPPTTEFALFSQQEYRFEQGDNGVFNVSEYNTLHKERTHLCKFPSFYRGYLGRLIHRRGLYISMWQQFREGGIRKNTPGWAEVFKYVRHQVDFTDRIVEHCIADARKERANETWIPKLLHEWLIIEFHVGSVSTSARQWSEKTAKLISSSDPTEFDWVTRDAKLQPWRSDSTNLQVELAGRKEVVGELYKWIRKEIDEFNSRTGTAKRKVSEQILATPPKAKRTKSSKSKGKKVTRRILDDDEMDQDVETEEQEEKEEQEVETVRIKKEFPESTEGEESEDEDEDEETIAERQMRKKMSQADKQKKGGNARMKGKGKGKSSVVVDPPRQTRRSRRFEPSQSTNEMKAVEEDLPSASQQKDVANQEASLDVGSPAGTQVPSVEDAPVNSETLLGDGEDIHMQEVTNSRVPSSPLSQAETHALKPSQGPSNTLQSGARASSMASTTASHGSRSSSRLKAKIMPVQTPTVEAVLSAPGPDDDWGATIPTLHQPPPIFGSEDCK